MTQPTRTISGTDTIHATGYAPQVDLAQGLDCYLNWIRGHADARDYFCEAGEILL